MIGEIRWRAILRLFEKSTIAYEILIYTLVKNIIY